MFEKVNPGHPDKVADRIAGAVVDLAYRMVEDPLIAVEVLIGHGICTIITESSVDVPGEEVGKAVARIAGPEVSVVYLPNRQDAHLAENQLGKIRCGDNGIFKGMPVTLEQSALREIAQAIWEKKQCDGKYILDNYRHRLVICQSNAEDLEIRALLPVSYMRDAKINPLGPWTGGTDVDTGATNRKLGSDMGDAVTGGGLHGKDLSKADVSVNIYAYLKAQKTGMPVELSCAIGDEMVDGKPYAEIVGMAREFIWGLGGFEKFAEWGLI